LTQFSPIIAPQFFLLSEAENRRLKRQNFPAGQRGM